MMTRPLDQHLSPQRHITAAYSARAWGRPPELLVALMACLAVASSCRRSDQAAAEQSSEVSRARPTQLALALRARTRGAVSTSATTGSDAGVGPEGSTREQQNVQPRGAQGSSTAGAPPTVRGPHTRGKDRIRRTLRVLPPLSEWDDDENNTLSPTEFRSGLFERWDTDDNQRVDAFEFQRGASSWFNSVDARGTFKAFDDDGDGVLSFEEFSERVRRSGVFERWDTNHDGQIGDDELSYVVYRGWDIDRDGTADIEEWKAL